jgi:DeoR/GlpR family transcriptional regulator of sugar metabolism
MLSAERRLLIAQRLESTSAVAIAELARDLDVSEMTIRRDLKSLQVAYDIVRIHGGAMLRRRGTAYEPRWETKVGLQEDAKRRIGERAAARVQAGETVIIDSGTTGLAVARALFVPCTVVVCDVKIAVDLASRPASDGISTLIVGGSVRPGYYSTLGPFATGMLKQLHADRVFLGADAIDVDAAITNATVEEADTKRLMIGAGREVVLVADGSKLGKVALADVAALDSLDLWITDGSVDPDGLEAIRGAGLKVEVV